MEIYVTGINIHIAYVQHPLAYRFVHFFKYILFSVSPSKLLTQFNDHFLFSFSTFHKTFYKQKKNIIYNYIA